MITQHAQDNNNRVYHKNHHFTLNYSISEMVKSTGAGHFKVGN